MINETCLFKIIWKYPQTKGHPALASDPLMEDTPVNIYAARWNVVPITRPALQITGPHMQKLTVWNTPHCNYNHHYTE